MTREIKAKKRFRKIGLKCPIERVLQKAYRVLFGSGDTPVIDKNGKIIGEEGIEPTFILCYPKDIEKARKIIERSKKCQQTKKS